MSSPQERIHTLIDNHPRMMGVTMLAISAFLFYLGVYGPYLDALAHEPSIGVRPMSSSFMSPILFLAGVIIVTLGPRALNNPKLDPPPTTRNKCLVALVLLAGWVVLAAPYCAVAGRIEALGYQIKGDPVSYVYENVEVLHKLAQLADRFIP